jgi:hypothetical protein
LSAVAKTDLKEFIPSLVGKWDQQCQAKDGVQNWSKFGFFENENRSAKEANGDKHISNANGETARQ